MPKTKHLLAEYARLIAKNGKECNVARRFLADNIDNKEFVELAKLSRRLHAELDAAKRKENE